MHSSFSHPRFHGWCTWKLKTSSTFKNTEDEVHVLNSHLIQYSYSTNPSFTSEIFCCRNIVARIFRREPNSSKITFNANTIWFTRFPISVAEISVAELFRRVMSCREFSARIEVVGINWWLKVSVLPCRQINGFCFRYFSAGAPNLIGKSPRLDDAPVFIPFFFYGRACAEVMLWSRDPKWRHRRNFLTLQWQKCKYLLSYMPSTTVINWTRQVWIQSILEWCNKALLLRNFFTKWRRTGKNFRFVNCVMAEIVCSNSLTFERDWFNFLLKCDHISIFQQQSNICTVINFQMYQKEAAIRLQTSTRNGRNRTKFWFVNSFMTDVTLSPP